MALNTSTSVENTNRHKSGAARCDAHQRTVTANRSIEAPLFGLYHRARQCMRAETVGRRPRHKVIHRAEHIRPAGPERDLPSSVIPPKGEVVSNPSVLRVPGRGMRIGRSSLQYAPGLHLATKHRAQQASPRKAGRQRSTR